MRKNADDKTSAEIPEQMYLCKRRWNTNNMKKIDDEKKESSQNIYKIFFSRDFGIENSFQSRIRKSSRDDDDDNDDDHDEIEDDEEGEEERKNMNETKKKKKKKMKKKKKKKSTIGKK